jgi:hypothetical protein
LANRYYYTFRGIKRYKKALNKGKYSNYKTKGFLFYGEGIKISERTYKGSCVSSAGIR